MQITQTISWPATTWPSTGNASQYSVLRLYPDATPTVVSTVTTTSASLTFDDSAALVFQVRPSSGVDPSLTYGPEVSVFVVGYVPCRAWLRQQVRAALADRADQAGTTINWPDDEINGYIQQSLAELNTLFPVDRDTTLPLVTSQRDYTLPDDFYLMRSVEYVTSNGKLHLYLKDKPFRAGESTATSYIGYPKLGIMLSPLAGRFYPGHFDVYEGQIHLDWDAAGDGDYIHLRYSGKRAFPSSDGEIMQVTPEDMNLLSLRTQMFCWMRTEFQDSRLSRWRTREDGGRRDDMPTLRAYNDIKRLYNELVNDRRELRPRFRRLERR